MAGATSPRDHGPDQVIDLGPAEHIAVEVGVAEREAPAPARRRFAFPRRNANAAMAIATAVLLLAAATVALVRWWPSGPPPAEATVRAFLEAARDGDIAGALAFTAQDPIKREFLVPEALDSRWRIVTVEQVAHQRSPHSEHRFKAEVYAEIEAYDGTRVGNRYRVDVSGGEASIEAALTVAATHPPFDHLDLNGVAMPVEPSVEADIVVLLPGVYELYPDLPSTMEFTEPNVTLVLGNQFRLLGDETPYANLPVPVPVVSAEGETLVSATLKEHYDACAADPAIELCPFGFPEDPDRDVALAPGASWEIVSYPQTWQQWVLYSATRGGELFTTAPGEARASVVITEDGRAREATVSCPIRVEGLYVQLDFDGGATLTSADAPPAEQCAALTEVP